MPKVGAVPHNNADGATCLNGEAMTAQPAILAGIPDVARYLSFSVKPGATPRASLQAVRSLEVGEQMLVGIGEPLVSHWGKAVGGLRAFPDLSGPDVQAPSMQYALWCWLRGRDQGEVAAGVSLLPMLLRGRFLWSSPSMPSGMETGSVVST